MVGYGVKNSRSIAAKTPILIARIKIPVEQRFAENVDCICQKPLLYTPRFDHRSECIIPKTSRPTSHPKSPFPITLAPRTT